MSMLRVIIFSLLVFSTNAIACTCAIFNGSLEEEIVLRYEQADSVVIAEVEGIRKAKIEAFWGEKANGEETHFLTIKSWKGDHAKHFYTRIVTECCMCGTSFQKGEKYLLFLHKSTEEGYYSTSSCSGNKALEAAGERIEILDKITPNKSRKPDAITRAPS